VFRITEDPLSGSLVQCLVKNYKNGSIVSVDTDVVGVMAAFLPTSSVRKQFFSSGRVVVTGRHECRG